MQILLVTYDAALTNRVSFVLEGLAIVTHSDPDAFSLRDAVLRAAPDLIIIDMEATAEDGEDFIAVVRAIIDHDPGQQVIAIGEAESSRAVLLSMRAGARDFLDRDITDPELRARVGIYREHTRRQSTTAGRLVMMAGGMQGDCYGSLAVNYAVLRARAGADTLLVDIMPPASEAATLLDLNIAYTIRNAVSDLPRLDRTLLSSAVARHEASGLHVLPMPVNNDDDAYEITPDDLLNAVAALRGLFGEVILNVGSLMNRALLGDLLREANLVHLAALQKLSSVQACQDMLKGADPAAQHRDHITLIVDGYDSEIKLTDTQIQQTLGLKRCTRLPAARSELLNALNIGQPLVLAQPRSPYTRALQQLANPVAKPEAAAGLRQWISGVRLRPAVTNV